MLEITHKEDYNAMEKMCEGASSSVAGALLRIITSHFVALWLQPIVQRSCKESMLKRFTPSFATYKTVP